MARKVDFSPFESRSARLKKYKVRRAPYAGPSLARGISLMYRRNKTNGTWVVKVSTGRGTDWTKGFALADDFCDSDSDKVLTFHEAQDRAKKVARGDSNGSAGETPITVDGALTAYEKDLIARNSNPYNAKHPRLHLTATLLAKPVALTTSVEWKTWRDSLLDKMQRSTINRLIACVSAALELAPQHDKRIRTAANGGPDWPDCRTRSAPATSCSATTRYGLSLPRPDSSTTSSACRGYLPHRRRPSQAPGCASRICATIRCCQPCGCRAPAKVATAIAPKRSWNTSAFRSQPNSRTS